MPLYPEVPNAPWLPWTPTLTNLTLGSGTVVAFYTRTGRTINYIFRFTLGAGSAVGTTPIFSLPVAASANTVDGFDIFGEGMLVDAGNNQYLAQVRRNTSTTVLVSYWSVSGAVIIRSSVTATAPFTFGTGDVISVMGCYEAAT